VERLIAVVQPLKVATLSTTRRARLVIVSLTLVCFVLAAFPLWTVGSERVSGVPTCIKVPQSSYRSWLIAVVVLMTLTLPYCILLVCTTVIIVFLTRSQHFRTNVSQSSISSIYCILSCTFWQHLEFQYFYCSVALLIARSSCLPNWLYIFQLLLLFYLFSPLS